MTRCGSCSSIRTLVRMNVSSTFVSIGGNRNPAAADWDDGVLAFGADNSIALWDPQVSQRGATNGVVDTKSNEGCTTTRCPSTTKWSY